MGRLDLTPATVLITKLSATARQEALTALTQHGLCLFEPNDSDTYVMVRRERPLDHDVQSWIVEGAPPLHLNGPCSKTGGRLTETGRKLR